MSLSDVIDDHANSEGDATAIRVGADVRGALDYDGDIDFFRFQAEQGQSYQIDVALGTLDDSIVELYDGDGAFLDTNDDYGDTLASRLYWNAPSSGERYIAVEGYGIGTYTLMVSLVDDHGNDFESATRITIRETVAIELENDDDIDVLVFRARPSTVYVLSLNWEYYSFRESSAERPLLAVYSSNGQEHTRLMGYDFSRISVPSIDLQWQAVTGGNYYIVIGDGNTEGAGAFYVTREEATEPTATPSTVPTQAPEPTPAAMTLSLDEYLTLCAPPESDLADDATYGDLSSELATEADRVEALTPPAQLSEWHLLNIENYRTIQAVFDTYPKDDVIDFANLLLIAAAADELEGKLGEVAVRLPEDVLQRMIEAGCIDPGVAPYDYVNEFESATRIAIGEAVAIEFESPDDEGMFVFLGEPGAEYVFTLDWESWIRLSDPSRPIMVLFDAGGQELARLEDDDSSQNMMMWQAVTGGDYYIAVGDGATFGSLALTVTVGGAAEPLDRDDHGNSEGEATAISVGADVPGVLDYDDDIDYFRFQAEQGQSYVVSLPQWSFSSSGTPPDSDAKTITLYDSAARQLASANLSSSPYGIAWAALNSEYIYIAIGEDGTHGSYTLTVAPDDHGHDPSTATRIAIGESVAFTLYGNDTDYLRFQVEAGQDYRVDIESLTSVWGMPRVAIHDSSGLELSSFGLDEEIIVEFPGSGDYYIAATMEPEGFGGFTLLVFSTEDDHGDSVEDATAVEFGEPVRGVLYPEDDPDFFVFQAESGEFYEIGVAGNLDYSQIDLYDSGEAHLESFGSKAVWKAGSAGEYYIEVTGYGSAPSYTLSVSVLEITDDHGGSAVDASAITVGESIEGAVNYLGDEDVFLFQVEAGAIYEIDVALGTLADSRLVVHDEPDEWKRRSYSPVLFVETHRNVWRSEYTGDSYLVVGFPGSESGSYTIKVARITLTGNTSYDTDGDGLIEVCKPGCSSMPSAGIWMATDSRTARQAWPASRPPSLALWTEWGVPTPNAPDTNSSRIWTSIPTATAVLTRAMPTGMMERGGRPLATTLKPPSSPSSMAAATPFPTCT